MATRIVFQVATCVATLTPDERKNAFSTLRGIAWAIERACESDTGLSRDLEKLRTYIAKQEREHRAMGVRMVGPSSNHGRSSVADTVDYFLARVIADGYGPTGHAYERQIGALVGLRGDYIMGALMVANPLFRKRFEAFLAEGHVKDGQRDRVLTTMRNVYTFVSKLDYCTLVKP